MSANDIRALENLNPISEEDGGNEYLVNGNMVPIAQAGQQMNDQTTTTGKEETKTDEGD